MCGVSRSKASRSWGLTVTGIVCTGLDIIDPSGQRADSYADTEQFSRTGMAFMHTDAGHLAQTE